MSSSDIYRDRSLGQIIQHNTNSRVSRISHLSHPFPQHILPDPIPNARYIRPVHEREVRQEGADEGTALDQLEGRRVVG